MEKKIDEYGDSGIRSGDEKVPRWLKFVYISLPIWGIIWFFLYWNGVEGWLNRGYWFELEKAANTTMPNKNYLENEHQKEKNEKNTSHSPKKSRNFSR